MGPVLGQAIVCRNGCSFRNPSPVRTALVHAEGGTELMLSCSWARQRLMDARPSPLRWVPSGSSGHWGDRHQPAAPTDSVTPAIPAGWGSKTAGGCRGRSVHCVWEGTPRRVDGARVPAAHAARVRTTGLGPGLPPSARPTRLFSAATSLGLSHESHYLPVVGNQNVYFGF